MTSQAPKERRQQKLRTRNALIEAARAIMHRGEVLSVTAAAKAAGISKATAYRYFPDPKILALTAGLGIESVPYENVVAGCKTSKDKLLAVTDHIMQVTLENEAAIRQYYARWLDSWQADGAAADGRRTATRTGLIDAVLDEFNLPKATRVAFRNALIANTAGEPMIALRDVAGLTPAAVRATTRDVTLALLAHYAPEAIQPPNSPVDPRVRSL